MNRGPRGCHGLEQLKNRRTTGIYRAGFNGRCLTQTPYNGTFVQRILVTAMRAVEGVPTGFAISILTRATNLRHQGEPGLKVSRSHRDEWESQRLK